MTTKAVRRKPAKKKPPMPMPEPLLLNADQAAALIGVSRRTFYDLLRGNRIDLPVIRLGTQLVRYHVDAVRSAAAQLHEKAR